MELDWTKLEPHAIGPTTEADLLSGLLRQEGTQIDGLCKFLLRLVLPFVVLGIFMSNGFWNFASSVHVSRISHVA